MKTEVDLYVIAKVKARREELGLSQESLSYALDYNRAYISKFETGKNKYNINHLNKIAKILKCSPRDFLPEQPI